MEQRFELQDTLIPVDDYYVLVDKKAELIGKVYSSWSVTERHIFDFKEVSDEYSIRDTNNFLHLKKYCSKIIAATKRIGNLALVEIPDEVCQIKEYAKSQSKQFGIKDYDAVIFEQGIENGYKYKAAQGTYTEEDMIGVLKFMNEKGFWVGDKWRYYEKFAPKTVRYNNHSYESVLEQYLQSLQKPIKAIVLEMEEFDESKFIAGSPTYFIKPKVHNTVTNMITPKEIIYG